MLFHSETSLDFFQRDHALLLEGLLRRLDVRLIFQLLQSREIGDRDQSRDSLSSTLENNPLPRVRYPVNRIRQIVSGIDDIHDRPLSHRFNIMYILSVMS